MSDKNQTPAKPETIRVRFLSYTICETLEGQLLAVRKGSVHDVPARAGRWLIQVRKAQEVGLDTPLDELTEPAAAAPAVPVTLAPE